MVGKAVGALRPPPPNDGVSPIYSPDPPVGDGAGEIPTPFWGENDAELLKAGPTSCGEKVAAVGARLMPIVGATAGAGDRVGASVNVPPAAGAGVIVGAIVVELGDAVGKSNPN